MEGIIPVLLLLLSGSGVDAFSSRSAILPPPTTLPSTYSRRWRPRFHITSSKLISSTRQRYLSVGDGELHPIANSRFRDSNNSGRRSYHRSTSLYIFSSDKDTKGESVHSIENNNNNSQNDTTKVDTTYEHESSFNVTEGEEVAPIEGIDSGWRSNIGRYLLPSWPSLSSSFQSAYISEDEQGNGNNHTDIEDSDTLISSSLEDYDEEEPEVVHTSKFSHNVTKYDEKKMNDVIDVECSVDEPTPECIDDEYDNVLTDNADVIDTNNATLTKRKLLRGALSAFVKGGKKVVKVGKKIRDSQYHPTNQWDPSIVGEGPALNIIDQTMPSDNNVTRVESVELQSNDDTSIQESSSSSRRRRNKPKSQDDDNLIFTSLESKDITTTTMSKQKKWRKRRRRVVLLYKGMKSAVIIFVATFVLGNIMNQFVDLSEDGESFEVHFGKVLSSPTLSPSPAALSTATLPSTTKSERVIEARPGQIEESKPKWSLFQTFTMPKQSYVVDGNRDRAQALGLVSRAVQRVGPATVRVETETYLDKEGNGISASQQKAEQKKQDDQVNTDDDNIEGEDRGDVFDGIPEAPPPANGHKGHQNIDFGQGSGIIINSEGYILTNAHVVQGATKVYVLLTDGRRFRCATQGYDDIVDVAVLKIIPEDGQEQIKATKLPVAQLGNSDQMEVGQFVTAIGSPGGLDNTCTIGIVSGLKRCPKVVGIPDKFGVLEYIQTDAAINQGNSGGPLVDVETGNIVGINTCIRANMEGTSFAIPINKVLGLVDDLSEGKRITHGYLGVHMSTMNPTLAQYYNKLRPQHSNKIPEREGVMIEKVFRNSPAKAGGLRKFDFVIEIASQKVENAEEAHVLIDRATIGEELEFKVVREGENTEIIVQVKPEDLSPRLKQLREERLKRKKKSRTKHASGVKDETMSLDKEDEMDIRGGEILNQIEET